MTLALLLLAPVLFLIAAHLRLRLRTWSVLALAYAALLQAVLAPQMLATILLWTGFGLPLLVLNLPPLRRWLITGPIRIWFRSVLPPISRTEQEAIDAGNVWWDAELFSGKPDFTRLLSTPRPSLSAEEQAFLDGPVEELCGMLDVWEIHEERQDLPPQAWSFIRDSGMLGMIIPRSYGGLEFSAQANSAVVMKIASRSESAAVTVMVPNSLGPGELLMHFGTEEQKRHYLPKLASGEEIPCFALTGPYAGSDAASMPDRGIVCRETIDGKEVLGLRVTWDKRYITLAPVATVLGLAVRVEDPDHLLGEKEDLGITCCLIPADTPGVELGPRHHPTGSVFMNGPTRGSDVFIPLDWVIGGRERVGQGWRMLMYCLSAGRAISLPALGTAGAKVATGASSAYSRIRRQFKVPIGQFEGISEVLAEMAGETYRMDAARRLTLAALDQGEKPPVISAILKYQLTEGYRRVVNRAMDIHGGKAICEGPGNYLAKTYQSIPVAITVEGANILTRSMIIFGQGAIRCHPHLLAEMQAAGDEAPGAAARFDRALVGHVGFTISNSVRTLLLGLSGGRLGRTPTTGPLAPYYRALNRMSAALAMTADMTLLILGGGFKFKETLSGRFADILSHLYLLSAVLKRFEDDDSPEADLPLVTWAAQDSLTVIQDRFEAILRNYPVPLLGAILRRWIFPWGRSYRSADDRTARRISGELMKNSATRDRLIGGIHIDLEQPGGWGYVEDAFHKALAAEAAETALRNALHADVNPENVESLIARGLDTGVITEEQAGLVRVAQAALEEVIAVDEFRQRTSEEPAQATDRAAGL
ncbi:MAG: acyl-CoA dehydrogenase [Xanthomonadales bacterium]|nr:acyl-CoA dehydrogenase [Xanthomonadales bacterium]